MTKRQYMDELKSLLYDIPKSELEEALAFYDNYFEDAGEENEEKVIASLGTPSHVASTIRSNVFGTADENKQEFTDSGFHDREFEDYYQVEKPNSNNHSDENRYQNARNNTRDDQGYTGYDQAGHSYSSDHREPYGRDYRNPIKWIMLALICLICLPVGGGALFGVVGLVFGLIMGAIGLGIGGIAGGVGMIVGGVAALIAGFAQVVISPFSAIFTIGVGCLLIGGGLLFFLLGLTIFTRLVPACYHGIIDLFHWIYSKIRGGARA